MKRFWLVLLTLGLVMAFSTSVFAADVKFTGSFYAAGMYLDNTSFMGNGSEKPSTAFYYQRMRIKAEFIATPALKLVTQFDAMERIWGASRSTTKTNPFGQPIVDSDSYGTREENENIAFDYAYIWYASKIGLWQVGILSDNVWGTTFGNNDEPEGQIHWTLVKMPFIIGGKIVKISENSSSAVVYSPWGTQTDVDADKYLLYGIYNFKGNNFGGQVGLLGYYVRNAALRAFPAAPNGQYKQDVYGLIPYAKAKIGPVAVEAEAQYQWGKARNWESGVALDDVKISSWYAYADALADFGMFYVGLTGAFVSGDGDPADDKAKNTLDAGRDWNPLLILFNYDRTYWGGGLAGWDGTDADNAMTNALFGMVRAGVRPVKDLDIMLAVAYAEADKKITRTNPPTATLNDEYGWEVDVTATYKITNNLSYMLGVGYLFTGDYYQGSSSANDVQDTFLVINKLTLTF
ncbi:MAG: hypothetical protein WBJ16_08105 [Smithellaceae bacterium]